MTAYNPARRSPHGERGLKFFMGVRVLSYNRRSPHGERGLKSVLRYAASQLHASLSSRRAWIEMANRRLVNYSGICRSPHGERGLK